VLRSPRRAVRGPPGSAAALAPGRLGGHPLRKDFEEKDEYHGIPTVRPNPIELYKLEVKKPAASADTAK
jgi:NADH-quinone oxidoreductase subunit C